MRGLIKKIYKNKNTKVILDAKCNYDEIQGEKYTIISPNIDTLPKGRQVKELYADLLRGKVIYDRDGNKHQIDVDSETWRPAIPVHKKLKSTKRDTFLNDIEVSIHGLVRVKGSELTAPTLGDSNGKICVKQTTSFSIREIRDKAFSDLGKEFLDEPIWCDALYWLESTAKKDNPNKIKIEPIICLTDNRTVILGRRPLTLLIKGVPNTSNIKYNSELYYLGHYWRRATEQETEEITELYNSFIDNHKNLVKYRVVRNHHGEIISKRGE